VAQQQRRWGRRTGRTYAGDVDEVEASATDAGDLVRQGVELGFRGAPVEPVEPVRHQPPQVVGIGTRLPRTVAGGDGEAGASQAGVQVVEDIVGDVDVERGEGHLSSR
jgi:hypothetical protein